MSFGVNNGSTWYRKRIGRSGLEIAQEAVRVFSLSVSPEELTRRVNVEIYIPLAESSVLPIEPNVDLVRRLFAERIRLGVVSSQWLRIIVDHLRKMEILHCISGIVSWEDAAAGRGKPFPDPYLLGAERVDKRPDACVAIEDTALGIMSAKRAGMRCIAYRNPNSGEQDLSSADLVVDDFSKIPLSTVLFRD